MGGTPAFSAPTAVGRGSSRASQAGAARRGRRPVHASAAPPGRSLGVVVTGSTRGLGLSLASEFAAAGDRVLVTSRGAGAVTRAVDHLRAKHPLHAGRIHGFAADVGVPGEVDALSAHAARVLGDVDAWVCNAGVAAPRTALADVPADALVAVAATNLAGSLLCARAAVRHWRTCPPSARGGHVFFMEGAGSDGFRTPRMAAYGASKRALRHLVASLRAEKEPGVGVHLLSPGMVLTGLLLRDGAGTRAVRRVFNVLAEEPETVARYLVPRIRECVVRGRRGVGIRFLTMPCAVVKLVAGVLFGYRRNRFFDEGSGRRVGEGRFDENGVRVVVEEVVDGGVQVREGAEERVR